VSEQVILEMRGISKSFPGVHALDNVNLSVRKGEVHALVGENGAGKSTLMKILSGAYSKDQGDILIKGQSVTSIAPCARRPWVSASSIKNSPSLPT
jgi:ABC-type sugar transport system ATPase subunit